MALGKGCKRRLYGPVVYDVENARAGGGNGSVMSGVGSFLRLACVLVLLGDS